MGSVYDCRMDELINGYADSAAEYAGAVQELRLLCEMRHVHSAYVATLELVEKARQKCELARLAFQEPAEASAAIWT
jgi:hypothetical protein